MGKLYLPTKKKHPMLPKRENYNRLKKKGPKIQKRSKKALFSVPPVNDPLVVKRDYNHIPKPNIKNEGG